MADSKVDITAGSGIEIDTRTESTNGQHRQVIVVGDPATNAGVAPVDATAGLKVNLGGDNDVTLAVLPDTASGDLAAIRSGQFGGGAAAESSSLSVTSATDEVRWYDVPVTVSSGAHTAGDVVFEWTAITNAVRNSGAGGIVTAISVQDDAQQKADLTLIFAQVNTNALSSGGANGVPDITFANFDAAECITYQVSSADYVDFASLFSVASYTNCNIPFECATTTLYVGAITSGTPTYGGTTGILTLKIGII